MKKIAIPLLFLLLVSINLSAQKNVDVDNLRFSYWERKMPKAPQDPMFFYYAKLVNASKSVKAVVDEQSLYDGFRIQGQRITDNPTDNDFIITLNLGNITITSSNVDTRIVENKDRDGKVTSRDYYYSVIVKYYFESDYSVTKGSTTITNSKLYTSLKTLTYQTGEYGTSKQASDYWQNNRDLIKDDLLKGVVDGTLDAAYSNVSSVLGFMRVNDSDIIKTIDEKKHPENLPLKTKSNELKAKLESLDGTNPLKEEDLADIIDYFKNIPERYTDLKLKADIRLRYVAYYNLCKIYLYLDQPEKVKPYADLILENGHDKKDSERMNEAANKLIEQFANSPVKTRQFNPDNYFDK